MSYSRQSLMIIDNCFSVIVQPVVEPMERFTALLLLLHKLVNTEHLPSLCCSLLIVSDCILLMEEMMESLYNPAICVRDGGIMPGLYRRRSQQAASTQSEQ